MFHHNDLFRLSDICVSVFDLGDGISQDSIDFVSGYLADKGPFNLETSEKEFRLFRLVCRKINISTLELVGDIKGQILLYCYCDIDNVSVLLSYCTPLYTCIKKGLLNSTGPCCSGGTLGFYLDKCVQ